YHLWARARSLRPAGFRNRQAASLLPPLDLAKSAAALLRIRSQGPGHSRDGAARRRTAADPQSRFDGRASARALADWGPQRRPQGMVGQGRVMVIAEGVPASHLISARSGTKEV